MKTLSVRYNEYQTFLNASELEEILAIPARTARHYCANPEKVPPLTMRYLVIRCLGLLPDFPHLRALKGRLILDSGVSFNAEELAWFGLVYEERDLLRQKLPLLNHNQPPTGCEERPRVVRWKRKSKMGSWDTLSWNRGRSSISKEG